MCVKIDECKTWADKAEALASYAKQANDRELHLMADRIQARAIRREGELLEEIEGARGNNQYSGGGGAPTKLGRFAAAKEAGLSKDQTVTALRVARVPRDEFEDAVESADPPTVTELARRGTASTPKPLVDSSPVASRTQGKGLMDMHDLLPPTSASLPAAKPRSVRSLQPKSATERLAPATKREIAVELEIAASRRWRVLTLRIPERS
jgi:hypothetical protein